MLVSYHSKFLFLEFNRDFLCHIYGWHEGLLKLRCAVWRLGVLSLPREEVKLDF